MATHTIQNFINELLNEQDRYDSLTNATPEQRERLRDQDRRAAQRAADPGYARTSGILRGGGSLEDALRDLESRGVQQRVTGALDPGSKGDGDYFGGKEMPRSSNELPRVAPRAGSQDGSFAREITQSNIPQGGQSGRWGGDAEAAPEQPREIKDIPAGIRSTSPSSQIPKRPWSQAEQDAHERNQRAKRPEISYQRDEDDIDSYLPPRESDSPVSPRPDATPPNRIPAVPGAETKTPGGRGRRAIGVDSMGREFYDPMKPRQAISRPDPRTGKQITYEFYPWYEEEQARKYREGVGRHGPLHGIGRAPAPPAP